MTSKIGKRWHMPYADYAWGQSTKDAYAEQIKKQGGEVTGTTGIPLGTADMTPFLSKISGNFDGLFGIFFGKDGVTIANQAFDLGLTKKYKWVGDGAIAEFDQPAGARATRSRASSASTATFRCSMVRSTRPRTRSSSTTPWCGSSRSTRRVRCRIASCNRTTRR